MYAVGVFTDISTKRRITQTENWDIDELFTESYHYEPPLNDRNLKYK